jgi:hypothetical protein
MKDDPSSYEGYEVKKKSLKCKIVIAKKIVTGISWRMA